jgi:hypothetical protein
MIGLVRGMRDEACPTARLEHRVKKHGHGVARRQDEWFVRKRRHLEALSVKVEVYSDADEVPRRHSGGRASNPLSVTLPCVAPGHAAYARGLFFASTVLSVGLTPLAVEIAGCLWPGGGFPRYRR